MKVLAVISQKGGAGKTTLAVHLATAAQLSGTETAIVDLDQQATAEAWGDWREDEPPQVIPAKPATLVRQLEKIAQAGAAFAVLDTPGAADNAARVAAEAADLILIPCRPVGFDLHAIEQSAGLVRAAGKPAFIVFNCVPASAKAIREDAAIVARRFGLEVAPHFLAELAAYRRSVEQGRTAQELEPDSRAARDIAQMWGWTWERVIMQSREPTTTEGV